MQLYGKFKQTFELGLYTILSVYFHRECRF